jgi:hypothetical protein
VRDHTLQLICDGNARRDGVGAGVDLSARERPVFAAFPRSCPTDTPSLQCALVRSGRWPCDSRWLFLHASLRQRCSLLRRRSSSALRNLCHHRRRRHDRRSISRRPHRQCHVDDGSMIRFDSIRRSSHSRHRHGCRHRRCRRSYRTSRFFSDGGGGSVFDNLFGGGGGGQKQQQHHHQQDGGDDESNVNRAPPKFNPRDDPFARVNCYVCPDTRKCVNEPKDCPCPRVGASLINRHVCTSQTSPPPRYPTRPAKVSAG